MSFRALLFSKSPETNTAMAAACQSARIRAEVCSDIFTAIEKGKKQAFSCVIADWADQPEASFLLKRARESTPNRNTVAIAIVDHDPTQAELRDNRLDYLVYRPISAGEAVAVLEKASEKMQPSSTAEADEAAAEDTKASRGDLAGSSGADHPPHRQQVQPVSYPAEHTTEGHHGIPDGEEEPRHSSRAIGFRGACAAVLVLAAGFYLWRSHETFGYLAQTPEGGFRVLRESVAALLDANQNLGLPAGSAVSDPQPDAFFTRDGGSSNAQTPALRVVATESTLAEARVPLRKAADFPLPVPTLERRELTSIRVERAAIPESMKNSLPITPPVVVTVNPAQMMPVSIPQPQAAVQQVNEPVVVSEEAERALLVQTVNPVYPTEALGPKLHGPVVLQVRVGRDGSVEDLKIVRGYFILGRAAIAAVKQWRFQPYTFNGHAAATQTLITINFNYPPG